MLFLGTVLSWQTDSWKRVRASGGTQYLLNTNRLDSIIEKHSRATLYYFDNPYDHRDSGHYMVLSMTVAQVTTQMDTAASHASLTLEVFPDNDRTQTPVDTEISMAYFAYAVADTYDATHSWVTYVDAGWDIKTVLVDQTLAELLAEVA